jgi:hypothetical protein
MVPAGKDLCLYSFESKGGAMQMLKQFQSANEGISDDKSKGIAEWAGKARADFDKLTDAHENEIVEYLLKMTITAYNDFKLVLNGRINGLQEFNVMNL